MQSAWWLAGNVVTPWVLVILENAELPLRGTLGNSCEDGMQAVAIHAIPKKQQRQHSTCEFADSLTWRF